MKAPLTAPAHVAPREAGIEPFTLSIFTENWIGLLHRVTTIFTKRHINIDSFTTSESEIPGIYRFIILIHTTEEEVHKLRKQLDKIVGVIKAFVLREEDAVYQELAMYKVSTSNLSRGSIERILREFHARVLHIEPDYLMIEKTGLPHETQALLRELEPFEVLGFSRSGVVAIARRPLHLRDYVEERRK
jgi:acetolactate synthase-1/3 small subunit